ncbi:MAG: lactonase family protein [Actinomycetales bacterium]|nr:lactonase family protein [Actinomycetales bacterium]
MPNSPAPMRCWVGCYPAAGAGTPAGRGEGIWLVEWTSGGASARQVATAPAPSYLALSPDGTTLFAVGETSPGLVVRYVVQPDGGLVERERVTSGGADPCHLLVHPSGRSLYVSQYGSGSLAVLPLEPGPAGGWRFAGGIGQVFEHSGRGSHERQAGPHVHSSVLLGDWLLALDLGTDELRRYRVASDGALTVEGLAGRLPHGTGPRHAAVTSDGDLLVVGELSAELYLLGWDPVQGVVAPLDRLALGGVQSLLSHVTVHAAASGDRAVVGVRGPDHLAVVDVVERRLVLRDRVATAGWPRHHAVVGDHLVVAGERAHRVVTHAVAGEGVPGAAAGALELPAPACVLPG